MNKTSGLVVATLSRCDMTKVGLGWALDKGSVGAIKLEI